jgi:hypothetical protein
MSLPTITLATQTTYSHAVSSQVIRVNVPSGWWVTTKTSTINASLINPTN